MFLRAVTVESYCLLGSETMLSGGSFADVLCSMFIWIIDNLIVCMALYPWSYLQSVILYTFSLKLLLCLCAFIQYKWSFSDFWKQLKRMHSSIMRNYFWKIVYCTVIFVWNYVIYLRCSLNFLNPYLIFIFLSAKND
jgi:hypothetical protein